MAAEEIHPEAARQVPPWWTDPTENVKDNLESERRRQDDLRVMESAYIAQIAAIREEHAREMRATARMFEDRIDHKEEQIRSAESARIDAIRLVDVAASQRTSEVQAATAQTLAGQVAASAEAMRAQVAAAAEAAARALTTSLTPMLARIEELSRAQYETQGQKQQVVETREVGTSARGAQSLYVAMAVLGVAVISLILLYATKK